MICFHFSPILAARTLQVKAAAMALHIVMVNKARWDPHSPVRKGFNLALL